MNNVQMFGLSLNVVELVADVLVAMEALGGHLDVGLSLGLQFCLGG